MSDTDEASGRSITRQISLLVVGRVSALAFTFAIPIVLVRLLSQEAFGLYKQVFLLQGSLFIILSGGLPWSLYYFAPRNPDDAGRYVLQALILLCGLALLGLGATLFFGTELAAWFNAPSLRPLLPLFALGTALHLLTSMLEMVLISLGRVRTASIITVSSEIAKSAALVLPVVFFGSVRALLAGFAIFGCARLITFVTVLFRTGLFPPRPPESSTVRAQLSYSLPFWVAGVIEMAAGTAPHYYVAASYDPATFAVFAVGCFTVPLIPVLFDSVADVTLVRVTEKVQGNDPRGVASLLADSMRKLSLICLPLFIFLFVVADDFITVLFTSRFSESIPVFRVFILMIPLTALSVEYAPRGFGETAFLIRLHALRALVVLVILMPLIQIAGLVGAACAIVIGHATSRTWALVKVKQLTDQPFRAILPGRDIPPILASALLPALGIIVLRLLVSVPPAATLVAAAGLYGTLYLLFVWKLRLLNEEEETMVGDYLRRIAPARS